MVVLLFGAPGSGKTTHGRHTAERIGIPLISSGEVLREAAERDERIAGLLAAGHLVPDQEVERMILDQLAQNTDGFVLDGFPRTVEQAEVLLRFLEGRGLPIDRVYYLHVLEAVELDRMSARGRPDDTPRLVSERLRVYREETEPVIRLLAQAGAQIVDIDNSGAMGDVFPRLDATLPQASREAR